MHPHPIRDAEISYAGTMSDGSQWVCTRAKTGTALEGYTMRNSIAVITSDGTLIGAQADCPTCQDPALRWLPFPEIEGPANP